MISYTALQGEWQKVNLTLNSQQAPHTSPSRASYGVYIVRILETIDRVITAPHCMWPLLMQQHHIIDALASIQCSTYGYIDAYGLVKKQINPEICPFFNNNHIISLHNFTKKHINQPTLAWSHFNSLVQNSGISSALATEVLQGWDTKSTDFICGTESASFFSFSPMGRSAKWQGHNEINIILCQHFE